MQLRYFVIIFSILLFLTACSSNRQISMEDESVSQIDQLTNVDNEIDKHVIFVTGGTFPDYPKQPVGETFNNFFENPNWKYVGAESGEEVVEFTGYFLHEDANVKVRLQFILHQDDTFEVGELTFNDVPQDTLVTNQMLITIFEPKTEQIEVITEEMAAVSDTNQTEPDHDSSMNKPANQQLKDIFPSMSYDEKKALNIFFSNFSEVNFGNFDSKNYNDADLINFGVLHNYINNNDRIDVQDSDFVLQGEYVTKAIKKYFGLNIPNQSTDQYAYEGDTYFWPGAAGEPFSNFSQVAEFIKNDDGTFAASILIYSAGLEYEGDSKIYEPMNDAWDEKFTPEYLGSASATVKGVTLNGKGAYQLLKYNLD